MSERTDYADGEFCWVDLSTTDVDGATQFYGGLLGVEVQSAPGDPEESGGYGFFTKDGKMVAGVGPTQSGEQYSAWSSYIRVADADAAAEKVKAADGSVFFGPADLPNESGRVAMLQDPAGAFIGIVQQGRHAGAEIVNEPGTWTWNNLLTRDVEGAKSFYGEVFGWDAARGEGMPDYVWSWQAEGQRWPEGLGGLMRMGTEMPADAPDHWQVYFVVEDLDRAFERTRDGGGQVLFGPQEVPLGRIGVIFDPQQAVVSLIEARYPEAR
ncbi:MAG: VOC family protein [Solirubrobacterales bacterium]